MADLREDPAFFDLLAGSYCRLVGAPLVAEGRDASWLYNDAPFALLAHNTEPDPLFIYANRTAQACFEYSWEELAGLPSHVSAKAPERGERQRLLDAVARNGFMTGYRGIRVTKTGRCFRLEDGVIWQLADANGTRRGQAAMFSEWTDL